MCLHPCLVFAGQRGATLNGCLDDAIAEAVTVFERQRDRTVGGPGVEHLGFLAHEMRNLLGSAMLTFEALSTGRVGIQGSTSTLHGRTLRRMRVLVDRTLAEVRLEHGSHKSERVAVAELIEEIEVVATIEAKDHDIQLSIDGGSSDVVVEVDQQILASVVANLVQNAFKFTRPHGHITVRAHTEGERVLIDVQDECGGLPPGKAEDLFKPFEQRGADKTGMGLGLSISLKGVRAIGGEIPCSRPARLRLHVHSRSAQRTEGALGVHGVNTSSSAAGWRRAPRPYRDERSQTRPRSEVLASPTTMASAVKWVLVVDDDDDGREIVVEILNHSGYHAKGVSSLALASAARSSR